MLLDVETCRKYGVQKRERITMGGKSIGKVRDENVQVACMATEASTMNNLEKWCGAFAGWGIAADEI